MAAGSWGDLGPWTGKVVKYVNDLISYSLIWVLRRRQIEKVEILVGPWPGSWWSTARYSKWLTNVNITSINIVTALITFKTDISNCQLVTFKFGFEMLRRWFITILSCTNLKNFNLNLNFKFSSLFILWNTSKTKKPLHH